MLGEEAIPEIEEPTEPHTIKEIFTDDLREIKEGKFWIPFKVIEFPFVIARQATIPFLDEDVYCKEINMITFITVPWFAALMAGSINYYYFLFSFSFISFSSNSFFSFLSSLFSFSFPFSLS